MIEVKNLTKRYGEKLAVDNISFSVNEGEILGFLGPNGAGKSTTMNILTGYLSSTEGDVTVNGTNILDDPIKAKRSIGYLPEIPPLYIDMTVAEYLDFVYDLKKTDLPRKSHIEEICKTVKITDVYNRVIKNLSKGYKQRVGLAQALIGNPEVLILDEPTVGLDPNQIIEIRSLIKRLGEHHTVILSSHILSEVQAVCDKIIIIANGRIVADDTTENLAKNLSNDHRISVKTDADEDKVKAVLSEIPQVESVSSLLLSQSGMREYLIESAEDTDIRKDLFFTFARNDIPLIEMKTKELSLEDIFLRLTLKDDMITDTVTVNSEKEKKTKKAAKKGGRKNESDIQA
ncbi:MAG: ABC transporter ATP-binding protein [Oscillospiraceae bacterium]